MDTSHDVSIRHASFTSLIMRCYQNREWTSEHARVTLKLTSTHNSSFLLHLNFREEQCQFGFKTTDCFSFSSNRYLLTIFHIYFERSEQIFCDQKGKSHAEDCLGSENKLILFDSYKIHGRKFRFFILLPEKHSIEFPKFDERPKT